MKEGQGQTVVIAWVILKDLTCSGKTLQCLKIPLLYLFAPTEYLTARPGRPRPAPALTDGQPWHQHSDPAGPSLSTVQLCHHSGSIHQQTDRVSGIKDRNRKANKKNPKHFFEGTLIFLANFFRLCWKRLRLSSHHKCVHLRIPALG